MLNRAKIALLATGLTLGTPAAFADHARWNDYREAGPEYDYARVVDVDPIYRDVRVTVPRQECFNETRYEEVPDRRYGPHPSAGSMILGGIIGAAIGNQIGSGDGRRAATVAGALIGTALGHDAAERRAADDRYASVDPQDRPLRSYEEQRCSTRYEDRYEKHLDGYRVTYLYDGHRHTTQLPYDPGERVRVRVDVLPED